MGYHADLMATSVTSPTTSADNNTHNIVLSVTGQDGQMNVIVVFD